MQRPDLILDSFSLPFTSNLKRPCDVTTLHIHVHVGVEEKVTLDWRVKKYVCTTRLQGPKVGMEVKLRFVQS